MLPCMMIGGRHGSSRRCNLSGGGFVRGQTLDIGDIYEVRECSS